MRAAFVKALAEAAEQDERIVLLTGDLGYGALELFADRFPTRFFNAGVAEQNMVGMATGLAESGLLPYVYSIAPFAALRPFEFIRNGPILHRLPVRVVGVGGGFEYGTNGLSHYGLEDLGIMRLQPGMTVLAPADAAQTLALLKATVDLAGPAYIRVGKDDRVAVPGLDGRFRLGHAERVMEGDDILWISAGAISAEVVEAASLLADEGFSSEVQVVSSLSPGPLEDLSSSLARFKIAVTVETHYTTGGLGSMVAELIADEGIACRLHRRGVTALPDTVSGSQRFMERLSGLNADQLASDAAGWLRRSEVSAAPVAKRNDQGVPRSG